MILTNFLVCKRFKWTQVWIFDQKAPRCWNKPFQWSKRIYWVFKYDGWRLSEYWWLKSRQKNKNLNCIWWHKCRHYELQKISSHNQRLFIRCRKLNISHVFITQSYFSVPKDVRWNSTHYLIMKINNRKELQNWN